MKFHYVDAKLTYDFTLLMFEMILNISAHNALMSYASHDI